MFWAGVLFFVLSAACSFVSTSLSQVIYFILHPMFFYGIAHVPSFSNFISAGGQSLRHIASFRMRMSSTYHTWHDESALHDDSALHDVALHDSTLYDSAWHDDSALHDICIA